MRVLVSGGAGYIGSETARLLSRIGHDVVVLDSLERGHPEAVRGLELVVGDVGDVRLVESIAGEGSIDAVLHFAALKSVEESLRDPARYYARNVAAAIRFVDTLVACGVHLFVLSSSCAVYGEPDVLPVGEAAPLRPSNPYGETKLVLERMLGWMSQATALRGVSLRYFNAAGAAEDGSAGEDWTAAENLMPVVLRAAAGLGGPVRIFGTDLATADGTAVRDYVHVADLAVAHVRALEYLAAGGTSEAVNVGTGRGRSVREVIATVERVTGRTVPVAAAPRRAGDPVAVWADVTRASEVLGWRAERDLDEIVESAWRWHCSHPNGFGVDAGE